MAVLDTTGSVAMFVLKEGSLEADKIKQLPEQLSWTFLHYIWTLTSF